MSTLSETIIKKNSGEFKFINEVINSTNNREFLHGVTTETLPTLSATDYSSFYTTLSAIGDDVCDKLYNNILNYIDNVGNVEICNIKTLQSMIDILGINYTFLHYINIFPLPLQELFNILTITPEYLVNSKKINSAFQNYLKDVVLTSDTQSNINQLTNLTDVYNEINNTNLTSLPPVNESYINISQLSDQIAEIYREHINSHLLSTRYDQQREDTTILQYNPEVLYKNYINNKHKFIVRPQYISENIAALKAKYNIPLSWDESLEVDNINNGLSTFNMYSNYQQEILLEEIEYRKMPFNKMRKYTSYSYYRERQVQDYLTFIEQMYATFGNNTSHNNTSKFITYDIDPNYLQYNKDYELANIELLSLNNNNIVVNTSYINSVVRQLTLITCEIWNIRHKIKTQSQKWYMKGTFLFLSYCINEYLKTTIRNYYNSISPTELPSTDATIEVIEYYDPTKYYNISTEIDNEYGLSGTNSRFWQSSNSLSAVMTENTTNIFSPSKTIASQYGCFSLDEIYNFYINILKTRLGDETSSINETDSKTKLTDFLATVFDTGADKTFLSGNDLYVFSTPELSTHKQELFLKYSGNRVASAPYMHIENTVHPSYKVHPYLYQFIEQNNIVYEIENMARLADDTLYTLVMHNIDTYIDDNGYLLSAWNNPLNRNSDYISEYEASQHYDANGVINPLIGYDGLFYPAAYEEYINTTSEKINLFYNKWYNSLNISQQYATKIKSQLRELQEFIRNNYTQHVTRYCKDIYGNMYILTKTNDNENDTGILWVRIKDHPLAFPAYYYNTSGNLNKVLSQIDMNSIENSVFDSNEAFNNLERTDRVPQIIDFYISSTKQQIVFRGKKSNNVESIIVANIVQKFNNDIDINRYELFLNKNNGTDSFDYQTTQYQFKQFATYEDNLGVLLLSYTSGHNISVLFKYFKPNIKDVFQISGNTTLTKYYASSLDHIKTDITDKTITFSFINESAQINDYHLSTSVNLITGLTVQSPNKLSSYIDIFNKPVVIITATINNYSIDFNTEQALYSPFTDMGFYPCPITTIIESDEKTLTLTNTAIHKDIMDRGIGKFQIIGPKSVGNGIFFRNVYPFIRAFETIHASGHTADFKNYRTYDPKNKLSAGKYKLLSYTDIHYFEEVVRDYKISGCVYTPQEFKRQILNSIEDQPELTFKVSEEFRSTYQYDEYFQIPYLISSNNNIPIDFYTPGKSNNVIANLTSNLALIKFSENDDTLSVQWHYNINGKIKLDFNSKYFNKEINSNFPNYYNYQHSFLNLDEPGEAGHLKIYKNTSSIKSQEDFNNKKYIKTVFYIKNISDTKPKFIISINPEYKVEQKINVFSLNNIDDFSLLLLDDIDNTTPTMVNILNIR